MEHQLLSGRDGGADPAGGWAGVVCDRGGSGKRGRGSLLVRTSTAASARAGARMMLRTPLVPRFLLCAEDRHGDCANTLRASGAETPHSTSRRNSCNFRKEPPQSNLPSLLLPPCSDNACLLSSILDFAPKFLQSSSTRTHEYDATVNKLARDRSCVRILTLI